MIDKILEFMRMASKISLNNAQGMDGFNADFKDEAVSSVVTKTDKELSKEFYRFVEKEFSEFNYVIVDEETTAKLGKDKFARLKEAEYQFVIDPIDGTQMYALQMPCYAISVGVLKNMKPFLGAICLPATHQLIYFDGQNVHWIENFGIGAEKDIIVQKKELSPLSVIFDNSWFVKISERANLSKDTFISFYSCVVHFFYMVTARGRGYYFGSFIWDMAGSWPMLQAMGFGFRNYVTGKLLTECSPEDFDENLKVKNIQIVCRKEDFAHLKEIVELR